MIGGSIDEYTAYCFDEACAYITMKIRDGEKPKFTREVSSFKDLYSKYQ